MRKKRLLTAILTIAVAACLIVGFAVRFQAVNSAYPAAQRIWYQQGETIPLPNCEAVLTEVKYWQPEELFSFLGADKNVLYPGMDGEELRAVTAHCWIKNTSSEQQRYFFGNFTIQNGNLSGSVSMELWGWFNEEAGINLTLEPGERAEFTLVFDIYQTTYPDSFWAGFDERPTDIVLSVYPEKQMVRANP